MNETDAMNETDDRRYCGVGIRGVAMTIDAFVWFALAFVAFFAIGAVTGDIESVDGTVTADLEGTPALAAFTLWLGLAIGYHTVLEWRYGKTLGKYLVGIRVAEPDGSPPTLRASLVRNVARLVNWLPGFYLVGIGVLLASERPTRLGDRVGETVVVRT